MAFAIVTTAMIAISRTMEESANLDVEPENKVIWWLIGVLGGALLSVWFTITTFMYCYGKIRFVPVLQQRQPYPTPVTVVHAPCRTRPISSNRTQMSGRTKETPRFSHASRPLSGVSRRTYFNNL